MLNESSRCKLTLNWPETSGHRNHYRMPFAFALKCVWEIKPSRIRKQNQRKPVVMIFSYNKWTNVQVDGLD